MCEVIWRSEAGFTNRGRSRASDTVGVETMVNGWGKMTSETQGDQGSSEESDRMTTKGTACCSVENQVVKTRLAELVWDVVRCVEGKKSVDVLEANETLMQAKKELNGELEGGTVVPHRVTEKAFNF